MSYAVLRITDGTTVIDLLSEPTGIMLVSWRPREPEQKDGGLYGSSPFNSGTVLLHSVDTNIIDTFTLTCTGPDRDWVIERVADLRRLLRKARDYWTSEAQNAPVWIEAQGRCETNLRYTTIINYNLPEDNDPYDISNGNSQAAEIELSLTVEHQYWQAQRPGTQDCVPLTDVHDVPSLYYATFNGNTSLITVTADPDITDLPLGNFCVEMWARPHTWGENNNGYLIAKGNTGTDGWFVCLHNVFGFRARAYHTTTDAYSQAINTSTITLNSWQHYCAQFVLATKTWRLFIDGFEVTYATYQAGVDPYLADSGHGNLIIGNDPFGHANAYDGDMGWIRVKTGLVHVADFTPLPRCTLPANDATTEAIWIYAADESTFRNATGDDDLDGAGTSMHTDLACSRTVGETDTCEEIPISSFFTMIDITHVYVWDDAPGVWSDNIQTGTFPASIAPAVPAADDYLYIGSCHEYETPYNSTYGPFQNFVMKYVAAGLLFFDVEFWNGAWTSFTTESINLIGSSRQLTAFLPVVGWITTIVNGVLGYWVRISLNGFPTEQVSSALYCANRPFVDILAKDVKGDVEALFSANVYNKVWAIYGVTLAIVSHDRNDFFIPAITASHSYYPPYPAIVPFYFSGGGILVVDASAPDGTYMQKNYAGIGTSFQRNDLYGYMGRIRHLHWLYQTAGALGDCTVYSSVNVNGTVLSKLYSIPITHRFTDLGIDLFSAPQMAVLTSRITFLLNQTANLVAAARDVNYYGTVLIPVEEWSGQFYINNGYWADEIQAIRVGTEIPKIMPYSNVITYPYTLLRDGSSVNVSSVTPPSLHPNKDQRLCIIPNGATPTTPLARGTMTIKLQKTERYLSARGSR